MRGKKGSGIDWSNIEQRRKARSEYQKEYAIKYPERVKESQRLYQMKHPHPLSNRICHVCKCGNPVEDVPYLRHKNKCRDCYNKEMRKYKQTPENIEKDKVWKRFYSLIVQGYIEREPCQICGKQSQAHHPDYSKPLQVVWLCHSHHGKLHRGHHYQVEIIDYEVIQQKATEAKMKEIAISEKF